MNNKNIVIIGGGAVGMLTGIHLEKIFPEYKIIILELRPNFTRKQIVLINQESRGLLPQKVLQDIWGIKGQQKGCYVLAPNKDKWARCYAGKLPLASVELKTLEKSMYSYIKKYTDILYLKPNFGKANIKLYKNKPIIEFEDEEIYYDILIASDGANSWTAKNFNIERVPITNKKIYGLVANISKKSKSIGYYNKPSDEHIKIVNYENPQNDWRFFRRRPNGFYIGLIIDQKEYENLLNKNLSANVIKRINKICEYTKETCNIKIKDINIFPVEPSYLSKLRIKGPENTDIFFIGDALVSTHYFTGSGLNMGFSSVKLLVSLLKMEKSYLEYDKEQIKNINTIKEKVMAII